MPIWAFRPTCRTTSNQPTRSSEILIVAEREIISLDRQPVGHTWPATLKEQLKLNRQKRCGILLALGLAALTASPASAGTRAIFGSSTSHSGTTFYVSDTQSDGRSAYGNWGGTSNNRLENSSGSGTTVSRVVSSVGSHRACVNISFAPDSCGAYGS